MDSLTPNTMNHKATEEALRESKESFKALAENANDGILIATAGGAHTYANRRASEITGYSVAELLKTSIKDLAAPDEVKNLMEKFRKRISGEDIPKQYETVIIRKDGKSVPIEFTSAKTIWHGQPAIMVIIRDITERKRAEEVLRLVQEKYTKAFLLAPDAITISELDSGRFVEVNEAATTIFGYSREELIGKSALELGIWLKKEDRDTFINQIREHTKICYYEIIERRKSGALYNASITADTITIGNLRYLIAIVRDVTERKQMEEALRESEERYRILTDAAHDVIYTLSPEGMVTFMNSGGSALIGMPPE
ncbi:MAG: PAS domain S-box protein, partial [Methanoregula sp.]|nr:PAS domain S-box protein [Methanoregula sp.]